MKKSLIILFTIIAFACEKEIPFNVTESEPRIVINSIFTANDTMWFNLTKSTSVLVTDSISQAMSGASANIYDSNGNLIGPLVELSNGNYYLASPFPSVGESYEVRIAKNGFKSVRAFSYTPELISINSIDTTSKGNNILEFDLMINDPASEENFYGIELIRYTPSINSESDNEFFQLPYFATSVSYADNGYLETDGKRYELEFFFSDESFNGSTFSFKGEHKKKSGAFYEVIIRSMSEELYRYKASYNKYYLALENPFAENVQVYSNVEKGFGVFGGYTEYRDTIYLE